MYLAVGRHVHAGLGRNGILAPPQASHRLLLGIKVDTRLAVKSVRTATSYRLLIAGERKHGKLATVSLMYIGIDQIYLQGRE
jgi:hypothetical protein